MYCTDEYMGYYSFTDPRWMEGCFFLHTSFLSHGLPDIDILIVFVFEHIV